MSALTFPAQLTVRTSVDDYSHNEEFRVALLPKYVFSHFILFNTYKKDQLR